MPFLRPSLKARAWDFGSAAPLSNRMVGRLWAADNYPRGANFCFTLPTEPGRRNDTGRLNEA